jgi:hypothetical protein
LPACRHPITFLSCAGVSSVSTTVIQDTFSRAIGLVNSSGVLLQSNVALRISGHAFSTALGTEQGNVLRGNLAIGVHAAHTLTATDRTPAAFYLRHPNNVLEGNRAAGGLPGHVHMW